MITKFLEVNNSKGYICLMWVYLNQSVIFEVNSFNITYTSMSRLNIYVE